MLKIREKIKEGFFLDKENLLRIYLEGSILIAVYKNKEQEYFNIRTYNSKDSDVQYIGDNDVVGGRRTVILGESVIFKNNNCKISSIKFGTRTIYNTDIKYPIFLTTTTNKQNITEQILTGEVTGNLNCNNSIFASPKTVFKNLAFKSKTSLKENNKKIDFSDSIFLFYLTMKYVKCNIEIDFSGTHFFKHIDIQNSNFSNFQSTHITCHNSVHFKNVIFSTNSFECAKFNKLVLFEDCVFNKNGYFVKTLFKDMLFLKNITQKGGFLFQFSIISILKIYNEEPFTASLKLNLDLVQIQQIEIKDVDIDSDSRLTFAKLKHSFIKQDNHIDALKFHSKEYTQHYKDLKASKDDWGSMLLLCLQKHISNFGTLVLRPLGCLLIFNVVLFIICNYDLVKNFDISLFPSFIFPWLSRPITGIALITIPINSFLIYEIIKSARRFSRKL